jgi:hypothetical protein
MRASYVTLTYLTLTYFSYLSYLSYSHPICPSPFARAGWYGMVWYVVLGVVRAALHSVNFTQAEPREEPPAGVA